MFGGQSVGDQTRREAIKTAAMAAATAAFATAGVPAVEIEEVKPETVGWIVKYPAGIPVDRLKEAWDQIVKVTPFKNITVVMMPNDQSLEQVSEFPPGTQ